MPGKTLLLSVFLFAATTAAAQNSTAKTPIETSEISYVEIIKVNSSDPTKSPVKKVDQKQYTGFAEKWNSSASSGADKYRIKYFIIIYTKNGQKRQFSVNGSKVQESGWQTFDIKDKQYFDSLWQSIE